MNHPSTSFWFGRPFAETASTPAASRILLKQGDGKRREQVVEEGRVLGECVGGEVSHFTTRSYRTLADFLLDASRNKLATSRTVGGAIWGGIKSLGRAVGSLGTKFFRWLGRKSGEVKQSVGQYLQTLKARGVQGLPADATLDAQVAAAHKLISAMVLAFRAPAAEPLAA